MSDDTDGIRKIAKEGSITFIGNITGRALNFGFVAVATRTISPSAYGVFTLGLSIVMFLQGFANLSLHRSIDYYLPKFLKDDEEGKAKGTLVTVFLVSIVTTTIAAIVIITTARPIAGFFDNSSLEYSLPLLALVIPFVTAQQILQGTFMGVKKMKYRVYIRDIVNPVGRLVGLTVFVLFTAELFGIIIGHLFGLAISIVVGVVIVYRNIAWIRTAKIISVSHWSLVSYALPLMFAGVIYSFVAQIDYFAIGYFLSSAEVGYYRVAFMLASTTLIVLQSITPIFKPMVVESQNDETLQNQYRTVTRWITILTLPIVTTFVLAPELYLSLFFTREYAVVSTALVALAVGYLANSALGPEGMVLEGLGHTRLTLFNTVILIVTNAVLDVVLVPRIGVVGAGIATATALTVAGIMGVFEVYYIRNIQPFSIRLLKVWAAIIPAAIGGFFLLSVFGASIVTALLLPLCIVLIDIYVLWTIGGVTAEDWEILSGTVGNI